MSYLSDHPTNFIWTPRVQERVNAVQNRHPWKTFINTYWDHPPDFWAISNGLPRRWAPGYYDMVSFDVWEGGLDANGRYTGYRGKPLRVKLGKKIFNQLFYATSGPSIDWIIYRGRMWWNPATGGPGWTVAPGGAAGSDPNHDEHMHVTYRWGT